MLHKTIIRHICQLGNQVVSKWVSATFFCIIKIQEFNSLGMSIPLNFCSYLHLAYHTLICTLSKNSFSHCFPTLSWQKDESANSKLFHTPPFNIKYIPGKSLRRVSTSFGHMPLFTYLMRNLVCRFDENPFANQLGQGIGKTNETVCGQQRLIIVKFSILLSLKALNLPIR